MPISIVNCESNDSDSNSESDEGIYFWLMPRTVQPTDQPAIETVDNAFSGDDSKSFTYSAKSVVTSLNEDEPIDQEDPANIYISPDVLPSDTRYDLLKDIKDVGQTSNSTSGGTFNAPAERKFFNSIFLKRLELMFNSSSESESKPEYPTKFESTKDSIRQSSIPPLMKRLIKENKEKKPTEVKKFPFTKKLQKMDENDSEKSSLEKEQLANIESTTESTSSNESEDYEYNNSMKYTLDDFDFIESVPSDSTASYEELFTDAVIPFPTQETASLSDNDDVHTVETSMLAITSEKENPAHIATETSADISDALLQEENNANSKPTEAEASFLEQNSGLDLYEDSEKIEDEENSTISTGGNSAQTPSMNEENIVNSDESEYNEIIRSEDFQEEKKNSNENENEKSIGNVSIGRLFKRFFNKIPIV